MIKEKLESAKIKYKNISDEDTIIKEGIDVIPVLEVDGERMNFMEANRWINTFNGEGMDEYQHRAQS